MPMICPRFLLFAPTSLPILLLPLRQPPRRFPVSYPLSSSCVPALGGPLISHLTPSAFYYVFMYLYFILIIYSILLLLVLPSMPLSCRPRFLVCDPPPLPAGKKNKKPPSHPAFSPFPSFLMRILPLTIDAPHRRT